MFSRITIPLLCVSDGNCCNNFAALGNDSFFEPAQFFKLGKIFEHDIIVCFRIRLDQQNPIKVFQMAAMP